MFQEIQYLKENLDTESRGECVQAVREKVSTLIQIEDWKGADTFFSEFLEAFKETTSVLGILKGEFHALCRILFSRVSEFECVVLLNRMQSFPWFDSIEEMNYKRGAIAENLARYSQGGELIELQKARYYYRKAQRFEDALRVQGLISQKVRSFNQWAPINPPAGIIASIHSDATEALQTWLGHDDDGKLNLLVFDHFGIRPSEQDYPIVPEDIFSSGLLEQLGSVQSIEISSSDGRISSGPVASPPERIEFDSWDCRHRVFLNVFLPGIKEWLSRSDEGSPVWRKVFGTLRHHLNLDENSCEHIHEGLTAWVQGFPHVALSFWLPYFETVLRNRLADLGEDVVCPRDKVGLEDFTTFDGLLKSAHSHFDSVTIKYWKRIFSKENGLGWNLRHGFCHGLLPMRAMRVEIYTFAVFQAYLFLILPVNEISNDADELKDSR